MTRTVELQGHRGARGLFPENTLAGFAATLAIGVDVLELDVGLTRDGVPVVTHDPALNPDITRAADGSWLTAPGPLIRSLDRKDLLGYDVGRIRPDSDYAASFPDQRPQDGARIPELVEVLRLDGKIRFDIELKTSPLNPDWTAAPDEMAAAVIAILDAEHATGRAVLQSFDWRGLRFLRRVRPEVTLAWLTRSSAAAETRLWWDGPDPSDYGGSYARSVAAEGGPIWAPEYVDLSEKRVREAHKLGLRVIAWTVNRPEDMRRLLRLGVDGLISDRPNLARAVMAAEGLELPPARPPSAMLRPG